MNHSLSETKLTERGIWNSIPNYDASEDAITDDAMY